MQRHSYILHDKADILGAPTGRQTLDDKLAAATAFPLGDGYISARCTIGDGSGGPPTDSPVGFWGLYTSDNGVDYTKVAVADGEVAKINPNGNARVSVHAILDDVPGRFGKFIYDRSSGGGGNSRVTLSVSVNMP